ncbi:MAG TPA: hypothetical protein VM597_18590 [Gemmataceae bacterium]|jgi:hypothetical protein|nr:hypothetical protein [Gemmataceae bacterium]
MSRCVLAAVGLLAVVSLARAQVPPKADPIRDWIADLDNPRYRLRDRASSRLAAAGVDAVKPLAQVVRKGSPEAADRALKILGEMADGPDPKAEAAARKELRKIADLDHQAAGDARAILARRRNTILAIFQQASVRVRETRGGLTDFDLDEVTDLDKVLPLLKEFPEIESVSLSNSRFTGKHAEHLAELKNLQDANLFQSKIDDAGLKHLTGLKFLRRVPMGHSLVTDEGLKTIGTMTQLEYVGVRGNKVTDAGLAHLKNLSGLTGLYLGETAVSDNGLKHLAAFPKLQDLYLHTTGITDAGLEHLKELKDLRYLDLTRTRTTEAGRRRLQEALPDAQIRAEEKP